MMLEDSELTLSADADALNSAVYVRALTKLLETVPTPFTIGLFGKWGSGKSSIIKTLKEELEQNHGRSRKAPYPYKFVQYDAWKYSGDSFRRAFLLELMTTLEISDPERRLSFYEDKTEEREIKRSLNWHYLLLIVPTVIVLIYLAASEPTPARSVARLILTLGLIAVSLFKNVYEERKLITYTPRLFAPEQFEKCFVEILDAVLRSGGSKKERPSERLTSRLNNKIERLIIVVDNLDRCDKQTAYRLLSEIKTFLTTKPDVLFVIPVDDMSLRQHIEQVTSCSPNEADEFLRKFFNASLKIKPFKSIDLTGFAERLNARNGLGLQQTTIGVVGREYASNPRRIIQTLNNVVLEKEIVAQKDGSEIADVNEPLIAKLLIIREEWPDLYLELSDRPHLLSNLKSALGIPGLTLEQQVFLRKTDPISSRVTIADIERLISNIEHHAELSLELITALEQRNESVVKELIEAEPKSSLRLVRYLTDSLDKAIGRGAIAGTATDYFNQIVYLNQLAPLALSELTQLAGVTSGAGIIRRLFESSDSTANLAQFLAHAQQEGERTLTNAALALLTEENWSAGGEEAPEDELSKHWRSLVRDWVKVSADERTLGNLAYFYSQTFIREDFPIEQDELPANKLALVLTPAARSHALEAYTFDDEARHLELIYLIRNGAITWKESAILIDRATTLLGQAPNEEPKARLEKVSLLAQLLSAITGRGNVEGDVGDKLITALMTSRQVVVQNQRYPSDLVADVQKIPIRVPEVLGLLKALFRLTAGKAGTADVFRKIGDINEEFDASVRGTLRELIVDDGFFGYQLWPYLFARSWPDSSLIDIFGNLVVRKKRDGKYAVDDEQVANIFVNCLHWLLDSGIDQDEKIQITDMFSQILADSRAERILAEQVKAFTSDQIAELPEQIQASAYEYICGDDRIFGYQSYDSVLLGIIRNNDATLNQAIARLVATQLLKHETAEDGIQLLELYENFESFPVHIVEQALKDYRKDEVLGGRVTDLFNRMK